MDFNSSACIKKNNNASYFKPNEDYIICDPDTGLFMVADGVTRDFTDLYPDPSPSSEASRLFCQSVYASWLASSKDDFKEIIGRALSQANAVLKKFNETDFLGKNMYEVGTVAVAAHISGAMLKLYYNGDCGCMVVRGDEKIQLTQPQTFLVTQQRRSLNRWQIRKEIQNNTDHPMGFGVFNGDDRVSSFIEYREFALKADDVVWLYSDGCEPAVKMLDGSRISILSPEELVAEAEQLEQSGDMRSDDKAAIRIVMGGERSKNTSKDFVTVVKDPEVIAGSENESDVIAHLIREKNLRNYFDIGCWYGLLLTRVLKKSPQVHAIAVEGVRSFIDIAKANCVEPARVLFIHGALVPQSRMTASYRINEADSSKSGLDTTGEVAGDVAAISVKEWALMPRVKERLHSCYMKLDLEGIDFDIIEELLALDIRPAVFHFEVLKRTRQQLPRLLALLAEKGYAVPQDLPGEHAFHSVICSNNNAALLGFKPFKLYRYG